MRVSDVVIMGKVIEVREGLRGTMNATIASVITYKGRSSNLRTHFLTQVPHVTNFDKDDPRDMALFFLAIEPEGNMALQCMSPLIALNEVGNLKVILDFVRDMGTSELPAYCMQTFTMCIIALLILPWTLLSTVEQSLQPAAKIIRITCFNPSVFSHVFP